MKEIAALIGMMLKEKFNIKYSLTFKNILKSIVPYLLKIVLVGGVSYLFLLLAARYSVFAFNNTVPLTGISLITTLVILIFSVSTTLNLTKTLYFSSDNEMLLTYPTSGSKLFLSKIIVVYINELLRFITFIFPIFVSYGIFIKLGAGFYIWSFFSMIFLSTVPLIIAIILAIPCYFLIAFFRVHQKLKRILLSILFVAIIILVIITILNLPTDLNFVYFWPRVYEVMMQVQNNFKIYLAPFYYLNIMVIGYPGNTGYTYADITVWITLLVLIASAAIIFIINYLINKAYFHKIAGQSLEGQSVVTTKSKKQIIINSKFLSLVKNEFLLMIRNENKYQSLMITYILSPVITLLITRVYSSLLLSELGKLLGLFFSMLIMLTPILTSNYIISSSLSQNGDIQNYLKNSPASPRAIAFSKIALPMLLSTFTLIINFVIFAFVGIEHFEFFEFFMIVISGIFIQLGTMFYAISQDLYHPRSKKLKANSSILDKVEVGVFIVGFLCALFFSAFFLLFYFENYPNLVWLSLKIFIMSVIYFTLMFILFYGASKTEFYKEEDNK